MWNTIIGQIEKCEITTSDNFVRVKGHLSVESGGLNHIQNLISTFGGVISIVSWESKYGNVPMAFMSYTMNNSILGFHFSIIKKYKRTLVNFQEDFLIPFIKKGLFAICSLTQSVIPLWT